jgi:hypothetical protein
MTRSNSSDSVAGAGDGVTFPVDQFSFDVDVAGWSFFIVWDGNGYEPESSWLSARMSGVVNLSDKC